MSDIDLTRAVWVAEDLITRKAAEGRFCCGDPDIEAEDIVLAVAPLIERQVRERIAADIEAERLPIDDVGFGSHYWTEGCNAALNHAARIARGVR